MSKRQDRIDPRVRRTRQLLRDALIALIAEKGYDAITIQDITERATLNRATFYLHYRDKDELLINGLEELWDELAARAPQPVMTGERRRVSLEVLQSSVCAEFEHLAEHAAFYRVMLGECGTAKFIHRMQDHIYRTTVRQFGEAAGDQPAAAMPLEPVLRFMASSYIGMMQWWLEHELPYPPKQMAAMLVALYTNNAFQVLGIEAD